MDLDVLAWRETRLLGKCRDSTILLALAFVAHVTLVCRDSTISLALAFVAHVTLVCHLLADDLRLR